MDIQYIHKEIATATMRDASRIVLRRNPIAAQWRRCIIDGRYRTHGYCTGNKLVNPAQLKKYDLNFLCEIYCLEECIVQSYQSAPAQTDGCAGHFRVSVTISIYLHC